MGVYRLTSTEGAELMKLAANKYGAIERYYLIRSLGVVYSMLDNHSRVFALRVDLRFAEDHLNSSPDLPICFQRLDSSAITRFMESLKSQLREDHRRSGYSGEPYLPKYIWVKERVGQEHPHYHLVLLFNKDRYAFLGDYTNADASNMATRIQKSWCSALELSYPEYASLVNFPRNNRYVFNSGSTWEGDENYNHFLIRLAYLCKKRSKYSIDGKRCFGCSQIE